MDKKKRLVVLLAAGLWGCGSSGPVTAVELSKADAVKLLALMGHTNIALASVVNGVGGLRFGAFSSPNVALVTAYGEQNGQPKEILESFFYDKDLGWFYSEIDTRGRKVRLWTTTGYQEVKPAPNK